MLRVRAHLISECDATSAERVKFHETLEEISIEKFDEYDMLPETSKWKWILAGGILRNIKKENVNQIEFHLSEAHLQRGVL